METQFNWKTKLFSRKYLIYQYDRVVGEMGKVNWSRKINGEIFGKKLLFETRGFFKQETQISDLQDNSVIASIIFRKWKSTSTINYQGKEYTWKYDNFFRSRWSLGNTNGSLVRYHAKFFSGSINSYTNDGALVLAGFFIRNHLREKSAHVAAAT
jgi:hypothetical protein